MLPSLPPKQLTLFITTESINKDWFSNHKSINNTEQPLLSVISIRYVPEDNARNILRVSPLLHR